MKKAWYTLSLWESPVPVTITSVENRPDGRPIYIHAVTAEGKHIDDYASRFSATKPALYH